MRTSPAEESPIERTKLIDAVKVCKDYAAGCMKRYQVRQSRDELVKGQTAEHLAREIARLL